MAETPEFRFNLYLHENPRSSEILAATWKPFLETCLEAIGTGRGMYESNFAVDIRISDGAPKAEKAAQFHETAARVYRIAS